MSRSGTAKHHDKNSSCRKFFAGDKESDSQYDRTIENKSGYGIAVKPGLFDIFVSDGIDDIEYHTDQNDKHSETDGDNKNCIQSSDKRYVHHLVHRFQPYGFQDILETEEAAVHETEKYGKYTGTADDSCKVHMFGFVKEQTAEEKDQSLADVTEHSSENKGICDGNKPCRIHFVVGRKSIHFYIHFKRFEKLWILKLCRWLFLGGSLLVFHETEDFFIVLNILLESKGILFGHPAAQNIEGVGVTLCAGGQFTDIKASGAGFKSGFCGNDRRALSSRNF